MKKTVLSILAAVAIAFTAQAQITDGKYILDFNKSTINWKATKVTGGGHEGTIRVSSGVVNVAGKSISGKVKVDMNGIVCTDLQDAGKNAYLLNHLKGEDFFNTVKFPDAIFETTKITEAKGNDGTTHRVEGNLTIKGITKPVSFSAKITGGNGTIYIVGDLKVDRTQFDIKYGSASFFDNLGDNAINNDFTLKVSLVGNVKK
jgi:polyisoprenoid-binding protein YceI